MNICRICGRLSGKRNICEDCKKEQPFPGGTEKGGQPFQRKKKVVRQ